MVIKLKEGCLVELDSIKIAKVRSTVVSDDEYEIVISYFDEKKNPNAHINCESEQDGNTLIDKLMSEIKNSKRIRTL